MRIWDLSPPLEASLPVWPGDTPFSLTRTWAMGPGCPVNVSRLTLSTHTGAHADAPLHYVADGADAASMDVSTYLGPCRLIDVSGGTGPIQPTDVADALDEDTPRVLLRTFAQGPPSGFPSDFRPIAAETIAALAAAGIRLIGVDTPSLDPETSKTLDAHGAAATAGMAILEGLALEGVPPGRYELIAVPLRLVGADASPVRALLRELPA